MRECARNTYKPLTEDKKKTKKERLSKRISKKVS